MDNEQLKKIQKHLLTTLIEFDNYCKKHNIKYSLCGGTLIGAIRHKGFIPWDDDTDVMMTRSEYNKLTDAWYKDPLSNYTLLTDRTTNTFYAGESGKWFRNDTRTFNSKNGFESGINMDIFIADAMPNNEKVAKEHFRQLHIQGKKYHIIRKRNSWFLMPILKNLFSALNHEKKYIELKKLYTLYDEKDCKTLALALGSSSDYKKECIPKHYFNSFTNITFESHQFPAISEYDAYLRHYYGDYMQLPPQNERISYHKKNHIKLK